MVSVFLPKDIEAICQSDFAVDSVERQCKYSCVNADSFTQARTIIKEEAIDPKDRGVLVLNFANPVNPGGGVRRGAKAQEEDLCRKSSLLI